MIAVISITQTGATELPDAEEAAPETPLETPIETVVEVSEETTELGLALADIPETMSAEQTVEAEHVARLREEELEPNTAVFRNSDGTNTLYIFSEEIWYENEDGEKVDYSTELEAATETAEAAYRATGGGGELLLPGTVGENTPIEYSEGGLSISLYPTTERIVMPEPEQGSVGELQQKPAALAVVASEPERGDTAPPASEPAAGEATAQPEAEQSETEQSEAESSQSSESAVSQSSSQVSELSVSQSSSQASEGTVASGAAGTDTPSSPQNGAASSQASESAAESAGAAGEASYAEPENGSAGAAIDAGEATAAGIEEMTPSAAEYRPV